MAEQLASQGQIYFATAALLGISGIIFAALALRTSGYKRTMLLLGALPSLAMAVAYAFMGLELLTVTVTGTGGREQSMARFFSYTVILLTVPYVLKELVGLSRRQFVKIAVPLVAIPWSAFMSWITTGAVASAASAGAFVSYLVAAYLLYVPLSRVARDVGGQRRLLFIKLCHLSVLAWGALIITSGLSEQSAGLLDFFVGQFIASYTDLIFMVSFAGLLYTNRSLFDERREFSTAAESTAEQPDSDVPSLEAMD